MKRILLLTGMVCSMHLVAQKQAPSNWQLKDPKKDKIYGVGAEEAYKSLKGRTAKTIIVAVIDGGTDVDHEDLKEMIWTNPGEIPDNGIDDDKNGYVDDIHGWNFLGGKNGDINDEATELARMYHRFHAKFAKADTNHLSAADAAEFAEYKKVSKTFEDEQIENLQNLLSTTYVYNFLNKVSKSSNGELSKSIVKKYATDNVIDEQIKSSILKENFFGMKPQDLLVALKEQEKHFQERIAINTMNADSIRSYIVGDNINDPTERYYGNNHVKGPDALHGSHVAGIIAAVRGNGKGIDGITNNVRIMVVRAVPNGDERDKDVANAIRYAVDNGASVINMSFGKYYSPDKKIVDDAVRYAMSKDVLLIHAAGNESKNRDKETSYPCRELADGTIASNWIEVGASSYKSGKALAGNFSNYGKKSVDFFAPGVNINSTVPDNKYTVESGTSMASPATAGAAALIRAYFPDLTATQVRDLLMRTVVAYPKEVSVPGAESKIPFSELSISGGIINVNNAVKAAIVH